MEDQDDLNESFNDNINLNENNNELNNNIIEEKKNEENNKEEEENITQNNENINDNNENDINNSRYEELEYIITNDFSNFIQGYRYNLTLDLFELIVKQLNVKFSFTIQNSPQVDTFIIIPITYPYGDYKYRFLRTEYNQNNEINNIEWKSFNSKDLSSFLIQLLNGNINI